MSSALDQLSNNGIDDLLPGGLAQGLQQLGVQNVVFPVAKAVAGGRTASQAFGFWDFGTTVGGQQVTLTDTLGHVITGTIPTSSGGSINAQFPMLCQ